MIRLGPRNRPSSLPLDLNTAALASICALLSVVPCAAQVTAPPPEPQRVAVSDVDFEGVTVVNTGDLAAVLATQKSAVVAVVAPALLLASGASRRPAAHRRVLR